MFGNVKKILLGVALVGGMMNGDCSGSDVPLLKNSDQGYILGDTYDLIIRSDKDLEKDKMQLKTFVDSNENQRIISNISAAYLWLLDDLKYGWLGADYQGALQSDKERTIEFLQSSIKSLQTPQDSSASE